MPAPPGPPLAPLLSTSISERHPSITDEKHDIQVFQRTSSAGFFRAPSNLAASLSVSSTTNDCGLRPERSPEHREHARQQPQMPPNEERHRGVPENQNRRGSNRRACQPE